MASRWRPPVERELMSSSSRERDVMSVSRIPKPSPKPSPKQTPPSKLRSTAAALRSELAHVSDQMTAAQQKLSGLEQQRLEAETPPHLRCPITLQRMCSPVRGLSQTLTSPIVFVPSEQSGVCMCCAGGRPRWSHVRASRDRKVADAARHQPFDRHRARKQRSYVPLARSARRNPRVGDGAWPFPRAASFPTAALTWRAISKRFAKNGVWRG